MSRRRALTAVLSAALITSGLAACGTAEKSGSSDPAVAVTSTNDKCSVAKDSLPTGTHTFKVRNDGSKVTELYVYADGDRIVGEVENVGPGLSRELIVELAPGKYQVACKPGMVGKGIRTTVTVTGTAATAAIPAELKQATDSYQRYVRAQADALLTKTTEFVTAVKAKDSAKAKELYPVARVYWERIEPVAESFGDLDPRIDARENDVEPGTKWTGYHRIEKDLWVTGDISQDAALADTLLTDVTEVVTKAKVVVLTPVQLANGAKELLDEVATGKVTGEEERYSHTDLWDFQANVDGSKAAISALRPVLVKRDPELVKTLDARFAGVESLLEAKVKGDGYVLYTELTKDEIRAFAVAVDALGEPLSKVAAVVAKK